MVDYGITKLDDLARQFAESPAFVRAALEYHDDDWVVRTSEVVVGREPPGWTPVLWEYASVALVAHELPANVLLRAFSTEGSTLQLGSWRAKVPAVHDDISFRRQPSRARHDAAALPRPTTAFEVRSQSSPFSGNPQGFVVGADCPSFTDFQTAVRAFFYGNYSNVGASSAPDEVARIRLVHTEAWIDTIRVTPTQLSVRLRGDSFVGTRVELNAADLQTSKKAGKSGTVRLSLRGGLPEDAWLYLSRGKRWLDYRALGTRFSGTDDLTASGITIDIPYDPESQLQGLLSGGEGQFVEYKSALPGKTDEAKRQVLKTVAAFATGEGGRIIFGVDPDELTVVGLSEPDEIMARDRLGNLIRDLIVPSPEVDLQWAAAKDKRVLVLHVRPGSSKPYGVRFQKSEHVQYYVRRTASTYPATQAEVRAAALSSAPSTARTGRFW